MDPVGVHACDDDCVGAVDAAVGATDAVVLCVRAPLLLAVPRLPARKRFLDEREDQGQDL
jgi:hypothetical protein